MEVTSTPAESSFFKALALNFEGGLPKNIFEKTLFSEKRVSKYGRLTLYC